VIIFLYFGVLIVGFYFLLVRPQRRQMAARRALVAAIRVGDEVVTAGGILGKVTAAGEQFLTVELAEGVQVKVQRHTVTSVLPKGTLKSA